MRPRPTEAVVHRQVCQYIRIHYPNAIFNSDGAGNNLSKAQAGMNKVLRSSSGYPDLFIAEPRGTYHGMFIELKRDGTAIYLKNGEMTANPHIREQAEILAELRARGFWADFAVGTDEAKRAIAEYMEPSRVQKMQAQEEAVLASELNQSADSVLFEL